ncbi:MAG: pilus assembly protein PilM [Candidatus Omnitrophica bacterium]|nr:pilus assembly protein PilM [Candidatus Omnitrophota bacterium]
MDNHKSLMTAKSVIGIDMGPSSVHVAQVVSYQGKPLVVNAVIEDIPAGGVQEKAKVSLEALVKALSHFQTKNESLIFTVSSQQAVVDHVLMPVMPGAELVEALKMEIKNSKYPFGEGALFDHQILNHVVGKTGTKMNVRVAVMDKAFLGQVQGFNFNGMVLAKIIPTAVALEHLFKNMKTVSGSSTVVLQIGSMSADLNIFKGTTLELSRKLNVTSSDLTRSLMAALSTKLGKVELTWDEAEGLKKNYGIPEPSEEYLVKGKITANQAISLLRPKLEQLIKDITRSLDSYYDKHPESKLEKLVLLGGGTRLKRLPEFLNAELGIPTQEWDPFHDAQFIQAGVLEGCRDSYKLVRALGAALSLGPGINLLPENLRDIKKKLFEKILLAAGAGGFVACSFLFFLFLFGIMQGVDKKNTQLESAYKKMYPDLSELNLKLILGHEASQRLDVSALLTQFSNLPSKLYFSDVNLSGKDLIISGYAFMPAWDTRKILKKFFATEGLQVLKDVELLIKNDDKEMKNKSVFVVKGVLKN